MPENKFTLLYLGNIGAAAGVELLIKAFHNARLKQAQLVIAGDGSARVACVALAERMGAADVLFVSDPDASNVPLLQSLAHVFLLPLRKGNGMTSVPSKLMAYLLSAKPVLATVDTESDTARCILESQCGWVGEPDNAQWLAGKMAEVSGISAEALVMIGMRGREYGLRHFSKAVRVKELGEVVENAVNGRKSDVRG
ncbi:MAG: glycosyltransferase [bacterium]